ncbi:MAG: hypothetical protein NC320_13235 [Clostridium sp.]|nr:hypothetical protein [Clostridium sp.]
MENNLMEISKILGVTAESLAEMPTDILGSMQTVLENIEVRTDEDRQILYDDLNGYWVKGTVLVELSEVSKNSGIAYDTLKNLDFDVQQEIVFEYMADSKNIERIYEITNKALAVMELEKVSELINIPVSKLKKLPLDIQEKMCGMYAMEYEENGDNSTLIASLKGMVSS